MHLTAWMSVKIIPYWDEVCINGNIKNSNGETFGLKFTASFVQKVLVWFVFDFGSLLYKVNELSYKSTNNAVKSLLQENKLTRFLFNIF